MKVVVLYRPNSEHARGVENYIRDLQRRHPTVKLDIMNIDTREGSAAATLYDIVQYPALLISQNDGSVQKVWMGASLPLMDEVASYASA